MIACHRLLLFVPCRIKHTTKNQNESFRGWIVGLRICAELHYVAVDIWDLPQGLGRAAIYAKQAYKN